MAISVSVPKEIAEYHEKILFGLSIRQLVFSGVAIVLSVGLGALCTLVLKLSIDVTGYVIMLAATPIMALGFIRKDNMPLEAYLALYIRSRLGQNRLAYETELLIDAVSEQPQLKKRRTNHEPVPKGSECQRYRCTAQGRTRNRKRAQRTIKAAGQEFRKARRGAAQLQEEG